MISKMREKTIIFLWILSSILLVSLRIFYEDKFKINWWLNSNTLNGMAQILATIFAISISLTLLAIQYYSDNISVRLTNNLFKNRFILSAILFYPLSIFLIIFTTTFPNSFNYSFSTFSCMILFLTGLFAFIYYIFKMNELLNPKYAIKEIEKGITKEDHLKQIIFYFQDKDKELIEEDLLGEIEEISIRLIRKHDYVSFNISKQVIFRFYKDFIKYVAENDEINILRAKEDLDEEEIDYNNSELTSFYVNIGKFKNFIDVNDYFLAIIKRLMIEIKNEDSEILLSSLLLEIYRISKEILTINDPNISDLLYKIHNILKDAGIIIINKNYYGAISGYIKSLDDILEIEISLIESISDKSIITIPFPFDQLFESNLEDIESIVKRLIGNIHNPTIERQELNSIVNFKSLLLNLVSEITKKEDEILSEKLIKYVLDTNNSIHLECINKNINLPIYCFLLPKFSNLSYVLKSFMKKTDNILIGVILTKYYFTALLESSKKGHQINFEDLKQCVRDNTSKYPDIVLEILDGLEKLIEILNKHISVSFTIHDAQQIVDLVSHYSSGIENEKKRSIISSKVKYFRENYFN